MHKVRNILCFAILAGIANCCFGLIIASFIDWSGITISHLLFPIFAGIFLGLELWLFYFVLEKEDASYLCGLIYRYPLIFALLSFLFLGEVIPFNGYVGMGLVVCGAVLTSTRLRKISFNAKIWMVLGLIIVIASYEFFAKVATFSISELHAIAVTNIVLGLVVSLAIFHGKTRRAFVSELPNITWAFFNESLTLGAVFCIYYGMMHLPATIFSSIGATLPLIVIFIERIFQKFFGGMTRDQSLLPKIIPNTLIVIGVILLYSAHLFG